MDSHFREERAGAWRGMVICPSSRDVQIEKNMNPGDHWHHAIWTTETTGSCPFLFLDLLALNLSLPGPCVHTYIRCLPASLHAGAWHRYDTKNQNRKEMYVD